MMIYIYTDGSSIGNPGAAGRGTIIQYKNEVGDLKETILSGGQTIATNNQMELLAVVTALECLLKNSLSTDKQDTLSLGGFTENVDERNIIIQEVKVFTDSQYVQKGITERIHTWIKRQWRLSKGGKLVKNAELRKQLHALLPYFPNLSWEWVRGHAGHEMNERVDKIARKEAMNVQGRR